MADFVQFGNKWFIGASTDTKPTGVEIGAWCIEWDTDKLYVTYDGTNWAQIDKLVAAL